MRAIELIRRAGIDMRQRQIGCMVRRDSERHADQLRVHHIQSGGFGIHADQFGGEYFFQPCVELRFGQYRFIAVSYTHLDVYKRQLHYQAVFTSKGAQHQLEVWRDGERRVKRRTDDAVETYAFHKPGDPEFNMSILDMKKRINTRIDRTNLYRIGNFTDWFDLAHGLKHPTGAYRVSRVQAPDGAPKAIKACQWYDLTQDTRTTHICWSAQSRIPLVIQAQGGEVVWKVTSLDQKHIPAHTFDIHDEGFIHNDANQDIEND